MQPEPTTSSVANFRDMFSYNDRENIPPDLQRALSLLKLWDLTGLEERFLATTAFLEPWAQFRDSYLLVNNSRNIEPSNITRLDILWFYTQFDENIRRHDPRASKENAHFEIDKSKWGPAEFEKHLYAWLLQTFCVGKAYSPFGFQYFELRNICTAWEEVLVPIVKAVHASYDVKGRRHYGRPALFIEDRCPSRLAFPEGNINMPDGVVSSPTPFRMVSKPSHLSGASQTLLTKKNYDEAEKELRTVYPQYGGLVERPRFKQKMNEWLEEQRVRAAHRKTIAKPETVQYVPSYRPKVVDQPKDVACNRSLSKSSCGRSCSPIKRYSESIRRSLSMNVPNGCIGKALPLPPLSPTRPKTPERPRVPTMSNGKFSYLSKHLKQESKSPIHSVTQQSHLFDVLEQPGQPLLMNSASSQKRSSKGDAWPLPALHQPSRVPSQQKMSEQSLYTSIRKSNPFEEDTPKDMANAPQRRSTDSSGSIYSPMGILSAIPRPLDNDRSMSDEPLSHEPLQSKNSSSYLRYPSYEGNGYHEEINFTNLHTRNLSTGGQSMESDKVPSRPRSRLPAPIKIPPPYMGQLRVASNDTYRNDSPSKPEAVPWPDESPPQPVAWPGFEYCPPRPSKATSTFTIPIPLKSPERGMTKRSQRSKQLVRDELVSHEMSRIVSKERIRAALGDLSRESLSENTNAPAVQAEKALPRVASPPRLETFNTHMFPKKETRSDEKNGW